MQMYVLQYVWKDSSEYHIHQLFLSNNCSFVGCWEQEVIILFSLQIGFDWYFSKISLGISNNGMSHILSVFSLAFLIHHSPLSACTRCSFFRFFTSVKAKPVKQQKMNMSLTVCNRWISKSLLMILRSSISFKNSRLHLVCLKCISANGSSVIHFFINAVLMISLNFFRYFTVAFCAQFFCILIKMFEFGYKFIVDWFNGISASLYCSLINSFKYLAVRSYRSTVPSAYSLFINSRYSELCSWNTSSSILGVECSP